MYTRGFGDTAGCPSLQQLMGINDPNDPCQLPLSMPAPILPGISVVNPTTGVATPMNNSPFLPTCPAGSTCSIFAGVPDVGVYTLGGILALFILYGVLHK